jgi:hypothetical protein
MKRNIAIALFALATLIDVPSAWAQDSVVHATVLFSFVVGGKLPEVESSTAHIPAHLPPFQMKETPRSEHSSLEGSTTTHVPLR